MATFRYSVSWRPPRKVGLAVGPHVAGLAGAAGTTHGGEGRRLETQAGRPEECSWPALAACWHGWPRAPASG